MSRQRTEVAVSIGMAAQLCGLHPQTLRQYERQGLVEPARTPGGTRRYREQDILRLRRIGELTEQGMSLVAVRYVLDLEQRIRDLERRVAGLQAERDAALEPRSYSLEIVHVPRERRGPRWRNADW